MQASTPGSQRQTELAGQDEGLAQQVCGEATSRRAERQIAISIIIMGCFIVRSGPVRVVEMRRRARQRYWMVWCDQSLWKKLFKGNSR